MRFRLITILKDAKIDLKTNKTLVKVQAASGWYINTCNCNHIKDLG